MAERIVPPHEYLRSIGLEEFSVKQLTQYSSQLQRLITRSTTPGERSRGLSRLPVVDSIVSPITPEEWKKVPDNTKIITAACGGSVWVSGIAKKINGEIVLSSVHKKAVPQEKKQGDFTDFITRMSERIAPLARKHPDVTTVAISLGYAQQNHQTPHGLDASFFPHSLNKGWNMQHMEDKSIGEALLKSLQASGCPIDAYYILNDANAVSHVTFLNTRKKFAGGFIFGTGHNASLGKYNLEICTTPLLPIDRALIYAMEKGWVPTKENRLEYWTGGNFVRARVAAAAALFSEEGKCIAQKIMASDAEVLVSSLAKGEDVFRVSPRLHTILQEASCTALAQAGQVEGLVIASVLQAGNYQGEEMSIPIEGSMFWKAEGIKEKAQEVISHLLPRNNITYVCASSMEGIAQLAMVKQTIDLT